MIIKNIEELSNLVNKELGSFCDQFQEYRKSIFKMKRVGKRGILFKFNRKDRDWVINPGGGTELQYHLYLRKGMIGYGLGFNTQYVPHKNKLTAVEYMEPYALSYLSLPIVENKLIKNGYKYLFGDRSQIENLVDDQYILIGKEFPINQVNNKVIQIDPLNIESLICDIKGDLFDSYKRIVSNAIDINSKNQFLKLYQPKVRPESKNKILGKQQKKIEIDIDKLNVNKKEIDYLGDHKKAIEIGEKAELIVLKDEIEFLKKNHPQLASKVCSVSNNSELGFDIISYETNGNQKQIEVKAISKQSNDFSFILTDNELKKSKTYSNFYLYGVSNINSKSPKILRIKNPDFENQLIFQLKPIAYKIKFS